MNLPAPKIAELFVKQVRLDPGAQMRVDVDEAYVRELAEVAPHFRDRIVTFQESPSVYWCADGFQRCRATLRAGLKTILADVYPGTLREAIEYALGANGAHGKRRTPEDLRRAFQVLLEDPGWATLPNRRIAEMVATSERTVRKYLAELAGPRSPLRTVERNGKSYTMNTAGLSREQFEQLPERTQIEIIRKMEERTEREHAAKVRREARRGAGDEQGEPQQKPATSVAAGGCGATSAAVASRADAADVVTIKLGELAPLIDEAARRGRRTREAEILRALKERYR